MSPGSSVIPGFRAFLVKPLEILLIAAMAVMTMDVLWGVFSRYILGGQSRWTEELAIYLLIWISLLGASLTYGERGHLGVDYFVQKLDAKAQVLAAVVVEVIVLVFSLSGLTYGGWMLVSQDLGCWTSLTHTGLADGLRLPGRAGQRNLHNTICSGALVEPGQGRPPPGSRGR